MFLVTVNWRGALNIGMMRTFPSNKRAEALEYYRSHIKEPGKFHIARGYETFSDKEPVLIWSCAKEPK